MWYFAWILGTALAGAFAVLNALWFELDSHRSDTIKKESKKP